jgi:hypothetical protein
MPDGPQYGLPGAGIDAWRDALRYLQQHPSEIRLLIAGLIMAVMDGGELSERACEVQPKLQIVSMSADPDGYDAELLAGYPADGLVQVKNRAYTQAEGRRELFERKRGSK